jgi:hypothetical protein
MKTMPDREIQSLIMQAGEIRVESQELRGAIYEFRDTLKRGLFRASVQGVVIVVLAVIFSITIIGFLSKPYTCDAGNLSNQIGSWHYKVCNVIFPSAGTQAKALKNARVAAKASADNQATIIEERKKTNDFLNSFQARVLCVLQTPADQRTDAAIKKCIGANP